MTALESALISWVFTHGLALSGVVAAHFLTRLGESLATLFLGRAPS